MQETIIHLEFSNKQGAAWKNSNLLLLLMVKIINIDRDSLVRINTGPGKLKKITWTLLSPRIKAMKIPKTC